MCEISEGNLLEIKNVVSYRGKVSYQNIGSILSALNKAASDRKAVPVGTPITATYAIENSEFGQIVDIEVLLPIDKEISVPESFKFKPLFRIRNAVKMHYKGSPNMMQQSAEDMKRYISDRCLTPITTGYNITINVPADSSKLNEYEAETYIGVTANIL